MIRTQSAVALILAVAIALALSSRVGAVDNTWTFTGSGAWEAGAYWSGGAPSNNFAMHWITNGVASKVVALWDGSIPAAALTISNLTISAPGTFTNSFYIGYNTSGTPSPVTSGPFVILNGFALGSGGMFLQGVATTRVDGVSGGTFNINGGSAIINGGVLITTNASTYVGNTTAGRMTISNGTWLAKSVYVGANSGGNGTLTFAGGTNLMQQGYDPLSVGYSAGSTGAVLMTGGLLVTTNVATYTTIGAMGVGQMTVSGGTWQARNISVGRYSGSQGTLTIAGGTVLMDNAITIAEDANSVGTVLLSSGQLSVPQAYIAWGGSGQMVVSGGVWQANDVWVGYGSPAGASGTLTIAGGISTVSNAFHVGYNSGATGTVLLAGGQFFTTNGLAYVGESGVGQMTISNGTWQAKSVSVGNQPGARGTLTIAGGTNVITGAGALSVGTWIGATGTVNVTGGTLIATNVTGELGGYGIAQMNVSSGNVALGQIYIGYQNGSQGTLTISGGTTEILRPLIGYGTTATGTVWLTGGQLVSTNSFGWTSIGAFGVGRMTVSNGTWLANNVYVGDAGGSQGTLTIAGGNSLLSWSLIIGNSAGGTGNLVVTDGSLVVTNSSGAGVLTVGATGRGTYNQSGGNVLVDQLIVTNGANSQIILAGGTLTVQNGATINNAYGLNVANTLNLLGGTNLIAVPLFSLAQGGSNTGSVLLAGGVLYTTNMTAYVGYGGIGRMTVSNGTWLAENVYVGQSLGSQGTLTIAGGTNTVLAYLVVANIVNSTGAVCLTGGRLTVTNNDTYIGYSGVGRMTVSNGIWLARDVYVGYAGGSQGTLTIAGGTNVFSSTFRAGYVGDTTGTVWLTGGQLLTTNGEVAVGSSGVGQMTVSNGTWLAQNVYIGRYAGAQGTLSIAGGTNLLAGTLTIGFDGPGFGGSYATGTVCVSGGQLVTTNDSTTIGNYGVGQMAVSGGVWQAENVFVGRQDGSQGMLTVAGGTNSFTGSFFVGSSSNAYGAVLMSGGQLTATNLPTYIGDSGNGQMTVAGGLWRGKRVEIGNSPGSYGSLTINGGTNLLSDWLRLGVSAGANGTLQLNGGLLVVTNNETDIGLNGAGQATVAGGTWLARNVYVGVMSGSQGTLTIAGGAITLNSVLILGDYYGATGTVWMSGGELNVTNTVTHVGDVGVGQFYLYGGIFRSSSLKIGQDLMGCGTMIISDGTLEMSGPLTVAETIGSQGGLYVYSGQLIATNPAASVNIGTGGDAFMYVGGGTVRAREVRVGDGTHPGTLQVGNGTLTGGSLVITPSGLLQLYSGNLSSIVSNQGVIQFNTANFTFHGGLDNLGNLNLPANFIVNVQNGLGNEGGVIIAGAGSVLNADSFRNNRHNGIMFLNSGAQLNVTAAWTNNGALELTQATIAGGTIQNASYIEGVGAVMAPVVNNAGGTVRANGGLLALVGSSIANQAGGYLEATDGSTLRINRSFANQGFINPQGGLIDLGANVLTNQGTLTGYGTYKAGLIVNEARAAFNGGNLNMQAAYLNSAGATTVILHVTANFFGAFTNAASAYFKNTGSDITFFGATFIGGTYLSDPAMNTFNGSVALDATGVLAGGAGDVFVFNSDFSSTNADGLQLAGAKIVFNDGAHTFTLAGVASIGTLELSDGASVSLLGADLIVGVFNAATDQFTTAQTIYYDPVQNPSLGAQSYALNGGGTLTAVPEPSSMLLVLFGVVAAVTAARRRNKAGAPART